jgi:hypothetical protein
MEGPYDTCNEAETLIEETTAVRTDAPYSLLQTVLIQDLSLPGAGPAPFATTAQPAAAALHLPLPALD